MIFVTVGTQLPFPRLIGAMDALAGALDEEIIAQTGPYDGVLAHMTGSENLVPEAFERHFTGARLVVAHAGIGSILSAKRYGKPLIVLPRREALGEHRNDHQLATAKAVETVRGVHVAWETDDIAALVARDLEPAGEEMSPGREALIGRLKDFIEG